MSEKLFTCRAGLTARGVFLESPRTGKRIELGRDALPDTRIVDRITQRASVGRLTIDFTREELLAVKRWIDAELERGTIALTVTMNDWGNGTRTLQIYDADGRLYVIGDGELPMLPESLLSRFNGRELAVNVTRAEWQSMSLAINAYMSRTADQRRRDRMKRSAFHGIH